MSDKISLYGLGGSGKSCYIFAMSQALSQGVPFSDGEMLTVMTPDPRQMLRLYKAYEKMTQGYWPAGNVESVDYTFDIRKPLDLLMTLDITDYRGGLLDSIDEDDQEEQEELLQSYQDSSVLLFFIGADKVKAAMHGDMGARFNIQYLNTLYGSYLGSSYDAKKTPVMVVLTKSDMLSNSEINSALAFLKDQMRMMFGAGTGITSGITAVTLGANLTNEGGELEGQLNIKPTAGNLNIPILFSLFHVMAQKIENTIGTIQGNESALSSANRDLARELSRSAFSRFFVNNESSIKSRINSQTTAIGENKELLLKLNSTMAGIKEYLLKGSELYINGKRILQ